MATSPMSKVVGHIRKMALLHECAEVKDEHLLEAFLARRDDAAFEALVRRHGPMVWGICRRILHDRHDAEDAFQATFLVLIRKASSIRKRELLANWLFGVAHRTALQARKATARRRAKERRVGDMAQDQATHDEAMQEMLTLLDQELSRLPDKYRVPIILCDLQGKTRRMAAQELNLPERTLSTRLARARVMLAKRLARYGTGFSAGALTLAVSQKLAFGTVPHSLVASTVRIAILFAAGKTAAVGAISAKVVGLTEGVVKTVLLSKLKTLSAALLLVCVVCIVVGNRVLGEPTFPSTAQQNSQATPGPSQAGKAEIRSTKLSKYMFLWPDGIDYKKHTISGDEIIRTDNDPPVISFKHRWSNLSIGPATKITIDGKDAKLADLQSVNEPQIGSGGSTIVFVEWTFEVVDADLQHANDSYVSSDGNKHPYRNGKVLRIDAKGRQVKGLVRAIGLTSRTITTASISTNSFLGEIAQIGPTEDYEVAKDVAVVIDNMPAKLADLKPNMLVSLQMSAVRKRALRALTITASGPKVEGIVKSVSSDDRLLRVNIPTAHVATAGMRVANDAKVVIDGVVGTLSDLKAGMRVTLQMSTDPEHSLVIGITKEAMKK